MDLSAVLAHAHPGHGTLAGLYHILVDHGVIAAALGAVTASVLWVAWRRIRD